MITVVGVIGAAAAVAMAVFGLPPVDLHGPLHRYGVMDPLCGGTRSAWYTVQGRIALAWRYNPLGIVTVLAAVAALLRAALAVSTGRWLDVAVTWTPRRRLFVAVVGIMLLAVLEVRQQARADLLTAGTWTLG